MASNNRSVITVSGSSFLSLLGVLFIGLKLTGHIEWSWWLVLLPIYGPWAILIAFPVLIIAGVAIGAVAIFTFSLIAKAVRAIR